MSSKYLPASGEGIMPISMIALIPFLRFSAFSVPTTKQELTFPFPKTLREYSNALKYISFGHNLFFPGIVFFLTKKGDLFFSERLITQNLHSSLILNNEQSS